MSPRIRLVTVRDDEALAELQISSRAFLEPWEPVRGDAYRTVAGQRAELEAALARHERGEALPLVVLDDSGEVAGRLTLSSIVRGPFQSCSMGYWLAERHAGKGFATEAVRAAVALAFTALGLHRVQAETLPNNVASQRVLAKAGFE